LWLPLVKSILINKHFAAEILRPVPDLYVDLAEIWRELAPVDTKHLGHVGGGGGRGGTGGGLEEGVADTEHLVCAWPCQNAVKNGQMHELYSVSFCCLFYIDFFIFCSQFTFILTFFLILFFVHKIKNSSWF
jgi:hypothetical protein